MSDYEVLQEMVDALPSLLDGLNAGIVNLNTSIDSLTDEKSAVQWTQTVMTTGASAWMEWKKDDINSSYTVKTSGSYGVDNLIQWAIVDTNWGGSGRYVYYTSSRVVSASPPTLSETQQYNRQVAYPHTYDHIHKVNSLTGTYGIDAKKSNLTTGLGLMTANRNKYEHLLSAYDRVLREK